MSNALPQSAHHILDAVWPEKQLGWWQSFCHGNLFLGGRLFGTRRPTPGTVPRVLFPRGHAKLHCGHAKNFKKHVRPSTTPSPHSNP